MKGGSAEACKLDSCMAQKKCCRKCHAVLQDQLVRASTTVWLPTTQVDAVLADRELACRTKNHLEQEEEALNTAESPATPEDQRL